MNLGSRLTSQRGGVIPNPGPVAGQKFKCTAVFCESENGWRGTEKGNGPRQCVGCSAPRQRAVMDPQSPP